MPRRIEIELPIPLPTWNRVLAMHHWERMDCRHLIHLFVSASIRYGSDWPTQMEWRGSMRSTDWLLAKYSQTIRPSKSSKSALAKAKASESAR